MLNKRRTFAQEHCVGGRWKEEEKESEDEDQKRNHDETCEEEKPGWTTRA